MKTRCAACAVEPARRLPPRVEKFGELIKDSVQVGHGDAWEIVQRWRCLDCGTIWAEVEEGGAPGHHRYNQRLNGDTWPEG